MSENSNKIESVKGLKIGDRIQGITFDANQIEKLDRFTAHRKELVVVELVSDTAIKFASADDKTATIVFDFKDDGLDKFYQANETTFTGLFTDLNKFQPALHQIYQDKLCPKLNELLDKFAQRANELEEPKDESQK